YRIELGEVEATINLHPAVGESIVVVGEDAGERRLVAYVVPEQAADMAEEAILADLRRSIGERLPPYMMPAAFVVLPSLPLSPTGKVDRRALPAPKFAASATVFLPPRTPTEIRLAEIWKALLKVDRVGAQDNFFDLGGHSLLATRVVARVARELGAR